LRADVIGLLAPLFKPSNNNFSKSSRPAATCRRVIYFRQGVNA
jgi:hypothetical protein